MGYLQTLTSSFLPTLGTACFFSTLHWYLLSCKRIWAFLFSVLICFLGNGISTCDFKYLLWVVDSPAHISALTSPTTTASLSPKARTDLSVLWPTQEVSLGYSLRHQPLPRARDMWYGSVVLPRPRSSLERPWARVRPGSLQLLNWGSFSSLQRIRITSLVLEFISSGDHQWSWGLSQGRVPGSSKPDFIDDYVLCLLFGLKLMSSLYLLLVILLTPFWTWVYWKLKRGSLALSCYLSFSSEWYLRNLALAQRTGTWLLFPLLKPTAATQQDTSF